MFDFLSISFLKLAFIGAILSAISTSLMSVFISLKRISFMSEALSHISFTGIALAFLLGLSIHYFSIIFVMFVVLIIILLSTYYEFEESNITMVLLSVSMALGILFLSIKKDYTLDLSSYMFGNILLINKNDLLWLSFLILLNLIFLLLYFKDIVYMTYHYKIAEFYHVPVKLIYFIFLMLLAFNIVVSVKIVGVIMITAQLVLPGMISLNISNEISKAVIMGVVISIFASISGFIISYMFNFPSGAVIVLVLFILFLFSLFFKLIQQKQILRFK